MSLPGTSSAESRAAAGAEHAVSGTVVDARTGKGINGASVSMPHTRLQTMTDAEGAFSLSLPAANVNLRVEATGFTPVMVATRGQKELKVSLSPLDGRLGAIPADVSPLGRDELSALPVGQTVADQSVADIAGSLLAISRSGMPGSGHAIFVKGLHSLNTSSQPLYIVDGVEWTTTDADAASGIDGHFNNPLALIAPEDIDRIYVMKNGAAIYGAKGGNGVVVIETKRAHNEATRIEAYARLGWRSAPKSIPMMGADDYRLYASDIIAGKYTDASMLDRLGFLNDDPSSALYARSHNDTDWLGLATRTALTQNYGVTIRGGDSRALYAFMLGYTDLGGTIKETDFSRINIRFNSDINLWRGVGLRFDVAYSQADYKLRDDGLNSLSSPYYLSLIKSPLYSPNLLDAAGTPMKKLADVDELGVSNPMAILDMGIGENRNYRFTLNAAPHIDFNAHWTLKGLVSYTFDKIKENSFIPDYGVTDTPLVNGNGETYLTVKNSVENLMDRHTTFHGGVDLLYKPLDSYENQLQLTGSFRYRNDTYTTSMGTGANTSSDYINDLDNTATRHTTGYTAEWRNLSYTLGAEYSYQQRYMLQGAVRAESASRFGKNAPGAVKAAGTPWGVFATATAAWLITSEKWMGWAKALNTLKLRLSLDRAGNDNLPYFATSTYSASAHLLGNAYGAVLANLGNDRLKWETTTTWQAGLDASFFDNRWQLTFDVYRANTSGLLISKTLKDVSGLEQYWTNGGAMRNVGINLATTVRVLNLRDWQLDLGASLGHYSNRLTRLDDGSFTTEIAGATVLSEVGHPAGVFYGYRTDGVLATTAEAETAALKVRQPNGSYRPFGAGDMRFVDATPDGVLNDADRQIIGDPNPDIFGNFNLSLRWKRLTLGALFTYSVGNDCYNALRANLESGSDIYNPSTALRHRWVAQGQHTSVPRATYGDPMGNARFSDRWIEDGSYLKWKSLSLEYNVPIRSSFLQGVTVQFAVTNLCTWTKYLGADPEFFCGSSPLYMGIDAGLVPQAREFTFGVKINL